MISYLRRGDSSWFPSFFLFLVDLLFSHFYISALHFFFEPQIEKDSCRLLIARDTFCSFPRVQVHCRHFALFRLDETLRSGAIFFIS